MAKFLTTKAAIAETESLLSNANRAILLISPYISLSEPFIRRLRDADSKGVKIVVVCRYQQLGQDQIELFKALSNCSVYDDPRLHAKCFINESALVLGSLNLYSASEDNNDMAILSTAEDDPSLFRDAITEATSIRDNARQVIHEGEPSKRLTNKNLRKSGRRPSPGTHHEKQGYCIRCGASLQYNPSKPYCLEHFKEWAHYSDPTYRDDYCHSCGNERRRSVSFEKPECLSCYRKNAA